MNSWVRRVVIGALAIGVVGAVVIVVSPKPPLPHKIQQQLTSTLFLPKRGQVVIERPSVKYDPGIKMLSFNVTAYGKQIIVSEQPTPEQFTDVPAVYQKVLEGMNDYRDFDVDLGTVHLTDPPQLHGGQTAVLNAKGTLLFVKPSANLADDQWRQLFTSFSVIEP